MAILAKENTAGASSPPRRLGLAGRGEARAGFLFALPWMVGLTIFTIIPLLLTFYIAQTKFQIVGAPKYVGLANYAAMWIDPVLKNTCMIDKVGGSVSFYDTKVNLIKV